MITIDAVCERCGRVRSVPKTMYMQGKYKHCSLECGQKRLTPEDERELKKMFKERDRLDKEIRLLKRALVDKKQERRKYTSKSLADIFGLSESRINQKAQGY